MPKRAAKCEEPTYDVIWTPAERREVALALSLYIFDEKLIRGNEVPMAVRARTKIEDRVSAFTWEDLVEIEQALLYRKGYGQGQVRRKGLLDTVRTLLNQVQEASPPAVQAP